MKKLVRVLALFLFTVSIASAGHLYKEKDYQKAWCEKQGGILEYVLDDGTRVDCLLPEVAVEFDFGNKWAESIGQALYYGIKTNRKAGVVLIMENPDKDQRYLKRLKTVADHYNIMIWTMTLQDL
ncbi:MAG: hypothetical protein HZC12_07820 [Nitrospirae bacterium]|nr:hypothetical protein [Nitrospirota bacterium]